MKYTYNDLDERIVKTRLALSGAIFAIMKKQKNVKVLDICKEAKITPMTYYHHFDNKTHLLKFAIKEQLVNKLPIPKKLKPQNMRQLVAYLIHIFSEFVSNNYEIIIKSVQTINDKGLNHSYIKTLIGTIKCLVANEIRLLKLVDEILINIWSTMITYGLLSAIIDRALNNKDYQFATLWNSYKNLANEL